MDETVKKAGFGGGCHWCTEAVFASLKGVMQVEQGFIASAAPNDTFSEAVVVTYNPAVIALHDLVEIHLHTHASTARHSMRGKYRSAIYFFNENDEAAAIPSIQCLQQQFLKPIITQVMAFKVFKPSLPEHQQYYYNNPQKPFCSTYISPKLQLLKKQFGKVYNENTG